MAAAVDPSVAVLPPEDDSRLPPENPPPIDPFYIETGTYAFHNPCRLQYARAVTWAAETLNVAAGVSPGLRN